MHYLKNKVVFLTGASRGIGAAAAQMFVTAGAKVALVARSVEPLERLAADLGDNAFAAPCDVSDRRALEQAIIKTKERFGEIDILINNAALIEPIGALVELKVEDYSKLIDINVKAVFNAMRLIVPDMIARGGGTVLTISSGAAHRPVEGWAAYCSSKAAAKMLTDVLHLEEASNGIRAMGLSPGTVATQMQRDIKASGINSVSQLNWEDHIPPEWPAKALLWMCSKEAEPYAGKEISLRDPEILSQIGLRKS